MSKTSNRSVWILFLCCFAFLFFIMMCTPPASDDLEFSALQFESFSDFISYVLYYGNGRVMGNIGGILLNIYPTVGALVKAFMITCIVFLLPGILELKNISAYLLSFLLVVGIDSGLFAEVYSWTSGFANYIPSVVLSLSVAYLLVKYRTLQSAAAKCVICIYICLFGFISQFFVEHSSGVNVLLAACAVILSIVDPKWRSIRIPSILWLIVTVAGLVGMFLVPKIFYDPGNRVDGYRQFNFGSLMALIYSCVRNGIRLGNCYLGASSLIVCVGGFLTIFMGRSNRSAKLTSGLYTVNFTLFAYLLLITIMTVDHWNGRHAILHHAVSAMVVVLAFLVWGIALISVKPIKLRGKLLLLLAFAVISLLPLLVVSPAATRQVFQSYIFVIMAVLLCASEVLGGLDMAVQKKVVSGYVSVSLVLVMMLTLIFVHTYKMNELREAHILRQMEAGAREIEIFEIPYDYAFWSGAWEYPYHYYYEEIGDIEFKVLELDPWGVKYLEANPYS